MKFRFISLIFVIWCNASWADFSNTDLWWHPLYLTANEPYLIDLRGEWPTDCHPGEQKPVISEYTGDAVLIEFEIIVVHVTCNEVATPYRVLVDMSDVVDSVDKEFDFIDVTVRFDGAELKDQLTTFCGLWCDPPPPPRDIKPEVGLYNSDGLEKQGLLLARQNQRMAVYPLIYDDSGSSEWLIGPGGIVENVFFSELYELTGGQCLGCPPPDEQTELNKVGKLSMLMESEGLVQVKINDGLFTTYEQSEFGYGSIDIGGDPRRRIPELSGRWAFSDIRQSPPQVVGADPLMPLVFDITLESVFVVEVPDPALIDPPPPKVLPGNVMFSMRDMEGDEVANMLCDYGSDSNNVVDAEMVCKVNNPDINEGDTLWKVKPLSVERLRFTYAGPIIPEIDIDPKSAVRID